MNVITIMIVIGATWLFIEDVAWWRRRSRELRRLRDEEFATWRRSLPLPPRGSLPPAPREPLHKEGPYR